MLTLVTGATGLVGNGIVKALLAKGHSVRALVRDTARAASMLPPGVSLVAGDVTLPESIPAAVQGVDWVFHAAGMPEQWQRDDGIFDRVNRQGTANVLRAALAARVKRAVYTSTIDVFAAPRGGTLVETNVDANPKHTAYERSKQAAEREAEAVRREGLEIVYVNPAAVYGPSPVPVALNAFMVRLLKGKVPLTPPGGMSVAYVDGVARAHLAAAERGGNGERYIVSDAYHTTAEMAAAIARVGELRKVPPTAPVWLVKTLAYGSAPFARLFRFSPLIAPGELQFLLWQARADSSKARAALGFEPTAFEEGVRRTIAFMRTAGWV
jgi:nucleoside-diphosphate-sugar epimerase